MRLLLVGVGVWMVGCADPVMLRYVSEWTPATQCYTTEAAFHQHFAVVETANKIYTLSDGYLYCLHTERVREAEFATGAYLCSDRGDCNPIVGVSEPAR
jgi:hypothetical protein